MQRFWNSTLSRWTKPMFGYLAIVTAFALLGSSLVRTAPAVHAAAPDKQDASVAPEATQATFAANAATLGAIPDSDLTTPACQNNSTTFKDVTFTVSGLSGAVTNVSVDFNASHTYLQDLEVTLTAPTAQSLLLFSATGTTTTTANSCAGSANDLSSANTYTFADSASANWWTTAVTNPVPTSSNRTVITGIGGAANPPATTSLNTAFASATANGTWTLRFRDRGAGDTGTVTAANLTITTGGGGGGGCTTVKRPLDFDGDGKTDFAVIRNTGGGPGGQTTWYQHNTATGPGGSSIPWGIATDFFTPADYDGDGKTDIAVWRPGAPTQSFFYILQSGTNTLRTVPFGQTGDDPSVVGDYDGDGKADPAVYRGGANAGNPSFWYYFSSLTNSEHDVQWGQNGDFPAPGDYDGDGKYDFTVQRNAGGGQAIFYGNRTTQGLHNDLFGTPTDVIVPGYYDSDCKADISTLRGSGGQIVWYHLNSTDGTISGVAWGASATDFPTQGDYDGDGFTDVAIWRPNADPSLNYFYVLTHSGGTIVSNWGLNGDYPEANFNSH